jgi:WD40 repeat protein
MRVLFSNFNVLCCIALVVGLFGLAQAATAGGLSTDPSAKLELGVHTGLIRDMLYVPNKQQLISAGDDKTIRIWQLPEGRLLQVIRVPAGLGYEGQIFAMALSPDGETLAVGGWTGWDVEGTSSVYLYNLNTAGMIGRIRGFPEGVSALRFMPDRQHLAVGLQGKAGLRLIRLNDAAEVSKDTEYLGKVMDMDVDAQGRLVTVASDGYVRLYVSNFQKPYARRLLSESRDAVSARFSPNGEKVAIGFGDKSSLSIVSGNTLEHLQVLNTSLQNQMEAFYTLAWSSSGERLCAAGDQKKRSNRQNSIWCWSQASGKSISALPFDVPASTHQRVSVLTALPNNELAFATEDPKIGVINARGQHQLSINSALLDFSQAQKHLKVSEDGTLVEYPFSKVSTQGGAALSLKQFDVQAEEGQERPLPLFSALINGSKGGVSIENPEYPVLNGVPLLLDQNEKVRHSAWSKNGEQVVLGTEWALRSYSAKGKLQWMTKLSCVAWAVNVTLNQQFVVAALSDGTIRWFNAKDGVEVLAYFQHANGEDWVAWRPDGFYMSSTYGDNLIGWHINRDLDHEPDFFSAVQFERTLYRPDLIRSVLQNPKELSLIDLLKKSFESKSTVSLRDITPPRLRISPMQQNAVDNKGNVLLRLQGESLGSQMQDWALYVNRIPVTPSRVRVLKGTEKDLFHRDVAVSLKPGLNEIRLEVFTGKSMGVQQMVLSQPKSTERKQAEQKGDLYLLAIGANRFTSLPESAQLSYAAQDAEVFASTMQSLSRNRYRQVHVRVLSDRAQQQPQKKEVLSALDFIKDASSNDTVIVFLASHGVSDQDGNYYFVPQDAKQDDITQLNSESKKRNFDSLISWEVFFDALRSIAGQRLLIVDTCKAQGISGSFNPSALVKRSASSLFSLFLASSRNEESQEYEPAGHGLFTHALLDVLHKTPRGKSLSLASWYNKSFPTVQRLRNPRNGPQTPQLVAPPPLNEMVVLGPAH